jgi:GNAT superfamily N-acetyltransferase
MELEFRQALESDLPNILSLLADDQLGSKREDDSTPINQVYIKAFKLIDSDPNNELIVAESTTNKGSGTEKEIAGILQLTFIPYLTYQGSLRCLVEGVRVHKNYRGKGVGTKLFEWAIDRAKKKSCHIIQLTSDKQRPDAIRFYQKLGFVASHEGFKLRL